MNVAMAQRVVAKKSVWTLLALSIVNVIRQDMKLEKMVSLVLVCNPL